MVPSLTNPLLRFMSELTTENFKTECVSPNISKVGSETLFYWSEI